MQAGGDPRCIFGQRQPGAALRFLQAGAVPRRKNRLSARGFHAVPATARGLVDALPAVSPRDSSFTLALRASTHFPAPVSGGFFVPRLGGCGRRLHRSRGEVVYKPRHLTAGKDVFLILDLNPPATLLSESPLPLCGIPPSGGAGLSLLPYPAVRPELSGGGFAVAAQPAPGRSSPRPQKPCSFYWHCLG